MRVCQRVYALSFFVTARIDFLVCHLRIAHQIACAPGCEHPVSFRHRPVVEAFFQFLRACSLMHVQMDLQTLGFIFEEFSIGAISTCAQGPHCGKVYASTKHAMDSRKVSDPLTWECVEVLPVHTAFANLVDRR